MELSSVNAVKLQNSDLKLTQKKPEETVTPEHGGGGVYIPPKKVDSVTISDEATKALNNEPAQLYHGGGGVYVPPKKEN